MVDIVAIGAHPDDIEFSCGGILAMMASQGKSIVMVNLTSGEKGTNGTPEVRRKEAKNAADVIGAELVMLDFPDCEIFDSYEGRLQLVQVYRKYKPCLILAPYWKGEQNHPDHIATGIMSRHACRYSRLAKILPELPIHRPDGILHTMTPMTAVPDFLIDITEHVETWRKMIQCHESQMKTFNFMDFTQKMAGRLGMMLGVPYAMGLMKGNPIIVDDIMNISKGTREV